MIVVHCDRREKLTEDRSSTESSEGSWMTYSGDQPWGLDSNHLLESPTDRRHMKEGMTRLVNEYASY